MFKRITLIMIFATLISCGGKLASTKTVDINIPPHGTTDPEMISCKHRYDNQRAFTYELKNSTMYKVEENLTVYKFTDINNKDWFINNFEILNYTCTTGQ